MHCICCYVDCLTLYFCPEQVFLPFLSLHNYIVLLLPGCCLVQSTTATRMGWKWTAPPAAPKCPACSTSVFPAESFMAADRKPFHKKCVKCKSCNKVLTSATLNEHETQLYCKACYDNIFMLMVR